MRKRRLDQALVDTGLAPSRERAMAMVLAGVVLVDDVPSTKPGMTIKPDATIRVKSKEREDWVGRGGVEVTTCAYILSGVGERSYCTGYRSIDGRFYRGNASSRCGEGLCRGCGL